MNFTTRHSTMLALSIFLLASVGYSQVNADKLLLEKAVNLRFEDPDSSILLLRQCSENFLLSGDTSNAIQAMTQLAHAYGHQANYKHSYDQLWKALLLADASENDQAMASTYIEIGRYYSFYKRKEEALRYFNLSLDIRKRLVSEGTIKRTELVQNYMAMCATFREFNDPALGKLYLDSCRQIIITSNDTVTLPQFTSEVAFLKMSAGDYHAAFDTYAKIVPWFAENKPSYLVLIYTYMADCCKGFSDFYRGERLYKQALDVSSRFHSHIDFTPLIHTKLSELYAQQGKHTMAYESLSRAKDLDEQFFDSRSKNNLPLLEIQDAFRKEKEYQKELLQEQRLAQLEHEESIQVLKNVIYLSIIVFLILIGIIYLKYVRSKFKVEKQLIHKEQELEMKKKNELLELKNKELAASALKLIEKDKLLATLKENLSKGKGDLKAHEVKQMVRSISISNARNWKEFETRFVAVNKDFYHRLHQKYPNLTQGDQKLCALIKLNFSSKAISELLGISVESVHTIRYRLRKKLKLTRSTNLAEYIASV